MRQKISPLLLAGLCVMLLSAGACKRQASMAESAPADCFADPLHICETGLAFARLEAPVADARPAGLPDSAVADSAVNRDGYVWLERTLMLPEGSVVVEGEFLDESSASEERISGSRVNRIRILSPAFRTAAGVGPGSSLGELARAHKRGSWYVQSIPDYGVVDISVKDSRIHYLVSDAALGSLDRERLDARDLPDELTIAFIVVM